MSIQVIGAGFGRTGTKSLQLALEILNFNQCYHMEVLLRNPNHVIQWENAYLENPVEWDIIFKDYKAIVDFPGSIYYKELAQHYPDAKVVLTIRDPESWYKSALKTIFSFDPGVKLKLKMLLKIPFSSVARNLLKVVSLNDKSIWRKFFEGKFKDHDYVISKFNSHIVEVKQTIPENRLLVFEVKDGWEPLCKFLNLPIPNIPFPNTNSGKDFHSWARGIVRDVLK